MTATNDPRRLPEAGAANELNKITRRRAKREHDQARRRRPIYLRAICPQDGKARRAMPRCETEAMNLQLAELATQVAPDAHAARLVHQAGHVADRPAQHHG
jgi:hypothetical protein